MDIKRRFLRHRPYPARAITRHLGLLPWAKTSGAASSIKEFAARTNVSVASVQLL